MSRSAAAARYSPPPGFVLSTSRSPDIEVYSPVRTELEIEVVERTLDETQARERLLEWLGATGFPPSIGTLVPEEREQISEQGIQIQPVWVARYEVLGRACTTIVNADGSVEGDRPVNWRRLQLSVALSLAPGVALGLCVGVPTLVFFGFGLLVWAVAFVFLLLGHRRWARLERIAGEASR